MGSCYIDFSLTNYKVQQKLEDFVLQVTFIVDVLVFFSISVTFPRIQI